MDIDAIQQRAGSWVMYSDNNVPGSISKCHIENCHSCHAGHCQHQNRNAYPHTSITFVSSPHRLHLTGLCPEGTQRDLLTLVMVERQSEL
jgi:hypothetical protein